MLSCHRAIFPRCISDDLLCSLPTLLIPLSSQDQLERLLDQKESKLRAVTAELNDNRTALRELESQVIELQIQL